MASSISLFALFNLKLNSLLVYEFFFYNWICSFIFLARSILSLIFFSLSASSFFLISLNFLKSPCICPNSTKSFLTRGLDFAWLYFLIISANYISWVWSSPSEISSTLAIPAASAMRSNGSIFFLFFYSSLFCSLSFCSFSKAAFSKNLIWLANGFA